MINNNKMGISLVGQDNVWVAAIIISIIIHIVIIMFIIIMFTIIIIIMLIIIIKDNAIMLLLRLLLLLLSLLLSLFPKSQKFKSQNFKLSVSNPKSKYVAYLSVLSQISNCQGLGRKNKHDILKTDRRLAETRLAQIP